MHQMKVLTIFSMPRRSLWHNIELPSGEGQLGLRLAVHLGIFVYRINNQ